MKHNTAKWFIGIIIIGIGVNLILKSAGISFSLFFKGWWTIPIIFYSIGSMIRMGIGAWNFGMLVFSLWLLANQQNWIPSWLNSSYIIGAAIIGFGLLFIFNPYQKEKENIIIDDKEVKVEVNSRSSTFEDQAKNPSYSAIFSGRQINNRSDNLESLTALSFFGGIELNLRKAVIEKDIVIDLTAIFGGIELKLPSNVNVVLKVTPLFGGVENSVINQDIGGRPTVTLRCLAAFGGVEIS